MMTANHPTPLTPEQARSRRGRNLAVALALLGFVAIVFLGTIAKMQQTGEVPVLNHPIGQ